MVGSLLLCSEVVEYDVGICCDNSKKRCHNARLPFVCSQNTCQGETILPDVIVDIKGRCSIMKILDGHWTWNRFVINLTR